MIKKRIVERLIVLLLSVTLLLGGCAHTQAESSGFLPETEQGETSGEDSRNGLPAPGGEAEEALSINELRMCILQPESLLPWDVTDNETADFLMLVMDPLFETDEEGHLVPVLAESFECVSDGGYIEITLKSDVHFHNGAALKAADVVYTIGQLKATENVYRSQVDRILKVEAVSEKVVRLSFAGSGMMHLEGLGFPIVPNQYKEALKPMGTGPYRLEKTETGREMIFAANEAYVKGKPSIETLRVYLVSDASLIFTGFDTTLTNLYQTEVAEWGLYQNNRHVTVHDFRTNQALYLEFNMESAFSSVFSNRQKIALAISAEAVARNSYYSRGIITETLVRPGTFYKEEPSIQYGYDPERAKDIETVGGNEVVIWYDENDPVSVYAFATISSELEAAGLVVTASADGQYDIAIRRESVTLLEAAQMAGKESWITEAATEGAVAGGAGALDQAMIGELPVYNLFFLIGGTLTGYGIEGDLKASELRVFGGIEQLTER